MMRITLHGARRGLLHAALCAGFATGLAACDGDETDPVDPMVDMAEVDMAEADMMVDPPDEAVPDAATPDGLLAADAALIEFGLVAVGGQGSADLVLRNDGDGPVEVTGFDGLEAPFSTNRSLPFSVPPGATRTVVLQFAPDDEGVTERAVTVRSDSAAEPVVVQLTGEGGRPEGELLRDTIDFGTIAPDMPAADFIEVQNTGDALELTVLEVVGLMPPFEIPAGQTPAAALPGETARILVQFAPEGDGEWSNPVTVRTTAGEFDMTIIGRALVPGELVLTGVEPAWAPVGVGRDIVVHGGPFAADPDGIAVGGVALENVLRLDEWRLVGNLPEGASADLPLGPTDVRVDLGGGFGLLAGAVRFTGPAADGETLDLAALEGERTIGPEGNPWQVQGDAVPEGAVLIVEPGTVLLFDGARVTVDGVLRVGGPDGASVFSHADCGSDAGAIGAWGGLEFTENEMASTLTGVQVECVVPAEGDPAIRVTGQSAGFTGLAIRGAVSGCLAVDDAPLTLLGGALTGCVGPGIALSPTASVFRLQNSRIRGSAWPITAFANNFGRLPIGAGHDWRGNTEDAIGLGRGFVGDVTLASQPAGVRYRIIDELLVGRGSTLALNINAPLVIDGPIRVEGTLALPGRTRIRAEAGGLIDIDAVGALEIGAVAGQQLIIEARDEGGEPAPGTWGGINLAEGVAISGGHLVVRDAGADDRPAVMMRGAFGLFEGLVVEDSAATGLFVDGEGDLLGVTLSGNVGGLEIAGGTGTITGLSTDPAPAVRVADGVPCDAWTTTELLDGMGIPAAVECGDMMPPEDPPPPENP